MPRRGLARAAGQGSEGRRTVDMHARLERLAIDDEIPPDLGSAADRPDADAFRHAFRELASGVAVVTFDVEGALHGFTVTSLTSVSMNPPLALFCVGNDTASRTHLGRGRAVGISVLGTHQIETARAFAQRTPAGGYVDVDVVRLNGVPVVTGSIAALGAEIDELHPAGDHTVCICALRSIRAAPGADPLLYYARKYHGHRALAEST